jgi:streptomycin 6-kinase
MAVHRRLDEVIHQVFETAGRRYEDEARRGIGMVRQRVRHAPRKKDEVTGPESVRLLAGNGGQRTLEDIDALVLLVMDVQRKIDRQLVLGERVDATRVRAHRLVLRRRLSYPSRLTVTTADEKGPS